MQTESDIKDEFAAHNITVKSRSFETTEDPKKVIEVFFVSRYKVTDLAIDVTMLFSIIFQAIIVFTHVATRDIDMSHLD